MPESKTLHDENGNLLLHRKIAGIAEICDECLDPIAPGDEMAIYIERVKKHGINGVVIGTSCYARHYCAKCGQLLEDSLVTTEAQ